MPDNRLSAGDAPEIRILPNKFISAVTLRREDVSLSSLISVPNFYTKELTRTGRNINFKIQSFMFKLDKPFYAWNSILIIEK